MNCTSDIFKVSVRVSALSLALCTSASFASAQTCVRPPPGLVSWWPGDGDAADIAGDNHGTLQNGATFVEGVVGQAFSFDGVDDFVSVPHAESLNLRKALTIDAWVMKQGSCQRLNCIVVMKEDVPAPGENDLRYGLVAFDDEGATPPNVSISLNTGVWEDVARSNTVLQNNVWYHVAGTYDGSTAKIYVNGILENSVAKPGAVLPSTGGALKIGQESTVEDPEGPEFFTGLIDEVGLYNRALSAHEIAGLFAAGRAGKCKDASLPSHPKVEMLQPLSSEYAHGELDEPSFSGFGQAIAIRNGIAFVGIPDALPGSRVAVYGQTATGWIRTATLTVQDPEIFGKNGFGSGIVFRDGLAVIASYSFLHVFKRIKGVWTDVQKFALPSEIGAMRLENGILVIGGTGSFGRGAAFVYELDANGKFVQRTTLHASVSERPHDAFGSDVAVAGNIIVVGDPSHDLAYVFRRRSDGTWVESQRLRGADITDSGSFGASVAIDQGLILVGAPHLDCLESDGGDPWCDRSGLTTPGPDGIGAGGAAYGFVPISGKFVQVFKLRPSPRQHADYFQFGRRIVMMGKYVVIDAAEQASPGDFDFAIPNGLSFTYDRVGSTLTARGVTSGYVQTDSIGLANNWLMIGTPHDPQEICQTELHLCLGEASVFDLNRFER